MDLINNVLVSSAFILTVMGIYGTTTGAHRLWTHKTFKANGFLRFWLMISQTMAGQASTNRNFHVTRWRRKLEKTWTLTSRMSLRINLFTHFLRLFLRHFRGQFTIGSAFTGCIIRLSRRQMIRFTATKISCTHKSSRTLESWARDKRKCLEQSAWKTSKMMESWCSRRGRWRSNRIETFE